MTRTQPLLVPKIASPEHSRSSSLDLDFDDIHQDYVANLKPRISSSSGTRHKRTSSSSLLLEMEDFHADLPASSPPSSVPKKRRASIQAKSLVRDLLIESHSPQLKLTEKIPPHIPVVTVTAMTVVTVATVSSGDRWCQW